MADKKTDKKPTEANTGENGENAPAPKQGKMGQLLPLILTMVMMPAVAYVSTVFVLVPQIKNAVSVAAKTPDAHSDEHKEDDAHKDESGHGSHGSGHGDSHGEKADSGGGHGHGKSDAGHGGGHGGHGDSHGSGHGKAKAGTKNFALDKLVVNVKNTLGQRYLVVEMTLVGGDTNFSNVAEGLTPQFRDLAIGILRQKSIQDLEQNLSQDIIRGELKNSFNNYLSQGKEPMIKAIYFTQFAVQ